ncbi:aspartyl protease family protein [Spirillospora sp. NBC_00431]
MAASEGLPLPSRRAFLAASGLAAVAGTTLPPAGAEASAASASSDDPDRLFKEGRFTAAERGYRRRLRRDPRNARAAAQLGYICLLSNRFSTAETFLTRAVRLDPGDVASKQRLAECYVRQDQYTRAVPLLRQTGTERDAAFATVFDHLSSTPWRIHGPAGTRVPFYTLDPVPTVEAAVNGGTPKKFILDTYATLDLSMQAADEAGVRRLATMTGGVVDGRPVTLYFGVLDSFKIGDIEIRDLPVQWNDTQRPPLPDGSQPAGAFGTTIFYHFLTTMDYAGRALALRRKTSSSPHGFHTRDRLPLWLAGDHFPCTLGSLRDYGPRMVTLDTGGIGTAFGTTVEIAERAGLEVDYEHPIDRFGHKVFPATADRISLGRAIVRDVRGHAVDKDFPGFPGTGQSERFGFDLIANFSHEFYKPFAVTFDYNAMALYIVRG